jgi:hypothetical protein
MMSRQINFYMLTSIFLNTFTASQQKIFEIDGSDDSDAGGERHNKTTSYDAVTLSDNCKQRRQNKHRFQQIHPFLWQSLLVVFASPWTTKLRAWVILHVGLI